MERKDLDYWNKRMWGAWRLKYYKDLRAVPRGVEGNSQYIVAQEGFERADLELKQIKRREALRHIRRIVKHE